MICSIWMVLNVFYCWVRTWLTHITYSDNFFVFQLNRMYRNSIKIICHLIEILLAWVVRSIKSTFKLILTFWFRICSALNEHWTTYEKLLNSWKKNWNKRNSFDSNFELVHRRDDANPERSNNIYVNNRALYLVAAHLSMNCSKLNPLSNITRSDRFCCASESEVSINCTMCEAVTISQSLLKAYGEIV